MTPGPVDCVQPASSAAAEFVAWSAENGLVPSDFDPHDDVYVLDRGATRPVQTAF